MWLSCEKHKCYIRFCDRKLLFVFKLFPFFSWAHICHHIWVFFQLKNVAMVLSSGCSKMYRCDVYYSPCLVHKTCPCVTFHSLNSFANWMEKLLRTSENEGIWISESLSWMEPQLICIGLFQGEEIDFFFCKATKITCLLPFTDLQQWVLLGYCRYQTQSTHKEKNRFKCKQTNTK